MHRRQRGRDVGVVGDRHGGESGARAVVIRRRMGGTQTVMTRRPGRRGEGCVGTRCPRGGTLTVMTRRPHRNGAGYVITRCRRSGTQAAMPRRIRRRGAGSLMARCPLLGGYATAVGRQDAETAPSRCSVCARLVSHPSTSVQSGYIDGVGRGTTGGKGGFGTHPPAPSPTFGEGVDCGLRRDDGPSPPMVPPLRRGDGDSRASGNDGFCKGLQGKRVV